ncbi:MAG: hypothetical protein KAT90_08905, partial [Gammaproteobacteria bacterium]|nr:hypothetical protein [Gammaproteobacteria bacterium]
FLADPVEKTGFKDTPPLILAKVNNINDLQNYQFNRGKINRDKAKKIINATAAEKVATDSDTTTPTKTFSDEKIAQQRQLFLQAEKALKKKNKADYFLLADQLKDYPLYPYLQYQWLRKNLNRETQVKHFLQQHSSSRYAKKLKFKWLHYLAKRKKWSLLLENQISTKDATLNCYYQQAELHTGNKQEALVAAQALWAVGHSQPSACNGLFSQLKKSNLYTQDLRWQRFNAALTNNKTTLASYIMNLMPKRYHTSAQSWLKLHRNPSRYLPQLLTQNKSEQATLMFRHAINRLASKDINKAIEIWDNNKQRFNIIENDTTKLALDKLEKKLAFKLVFESDPAAYKRLAQLDKQDNSSRTWRIRVALSEQNWTNVLAAIHDLNDDEKTQDKWQYWLARAYMETGETAMAQALLKDISDKRSFYGFLAADKMNSLYQLSDNPVNVSAEEIATIKNKKEFSVAYEFMMLDRKTTAKLQWWHALKQLNKKEIIIAAKLA